MSQKLIPIEDFFRNSNSSSYNLSPDGKYIAFMAPYKDRYNIFVRPIHASDAEAIRLTSEEERSLAGFAWISNDRIIYAKDVAGDENYQLHGICIDGSNAIAYTDFPGVRSRIIDDLRDQPDYILISMNKRNKEVFDPYRLNIRTGELTLLAENPGNYSGWMTDHAGKLRVVSAVVDGVNTQILYRDTEDEDFRVVLTTDFRDEVSFLAFTPDNKEVYASTNLNRDKGVLVRMNPSTCEELEVLYAHDKYDVMGIAYSRKRQCLASVGCYGHKLPIVHYFDEFARQRKERLKAHFPGQEVAIVDYDDDERMCIVVTGDDRAYGKVWLYDSLTDELSLIVVERDWLNPDDMNEMGICTYTTRDGLNIEAYLTLPNHLTMDEAKHLPIIVHPHGGPWSRNSWGFSTEAQFFANRGYAVFEMNYRGSTGYGRRFLEASYKQWGKAMQDDITDGVQWLIEQGIADPKRVAIYGGSYGGYATLAGLAFTPELYACGIDYVGVSNLLTFLNTIPPYWRPYLKMMYEQVGDPEADREQLEATSPALHADRIVAPLFIAQGANDPRVNKAESDQMVEALRSRGVEVEYMVKDNEGHGFHNLENRLDFYRAVEKFLAEHL